MNTENIQIAEYSGSLKECSDPFPEVSGDPYRYFNQPIELIPGWDASVAQILFHGKDNGLYWQTISDCVDLMECVEVANVSNGGGSNSGSDKELKITERRIRPLQDLGILTTNSCPNIPLQKIDVVTCVQFNGSELSFDRTSVYVLDTGDPDTTCNSIPVTTCDDGASAFVYDMASNTWKIKSNSTNE